MEDNTNTNDGSLILHGVDEEKQSNRNTNLLYALEAKDGAKYVRTAAGNLIKTVESDRRTESTKVQRKIDKKNKG